MSFSYRLSIVQVLKEIIIDQVIQFFITDGHIGCEDRIVTIKLCKMALIVIQTNR